MKATIILLAALGLAGCGPKASSDDALGARTNVNEAAVDSALVGSNLTLTPDGKPVLAPTPRATPAKIALPPAFLGRWGINDADCDVSRGDAKGLLIISADTLKYYESTGKLTGLSASSRYKVTADLAFTGEGQSWQKRETLELLNAGTVLVETAASAPTRLRYARCA